MEFTLENGMMRKMNMKELEYSLQKMDFNMQAGS